jgi:hypothetical protein
MASSLEEVILETVKERFSDAMIESISIDPDKDSDGDAILRITIIFDSDIEKLESAKLTGLVRHVRPKLAAQKEDRFPIFRFVSKRENDRLKHAAA